MATVEIRMCDEDREKLGGPEWVPLDRERLLSTPSERIERWEEDEFGGYSVTRALLECGAGKFAAARPKRILLWLARKQSPGRPHVDADGNPEPFSALAQVQAHRIEFRSPKANDADPPDQAGSEPETS